MRRQSSSQVSSSLATVTVAMVIVTLLFDSHLVTQWNVQRGIGLCNTGDWQVAKAKKFSPLLYVHFHKSGGTEVCKTMRKVYNMTDLRGLKREKYNCNVEFSGPGNNVERYHSMQICRLLEMYTEDSIGTPFQRDNFLAVEVPFHDAMPCPGFRSFAIMRDPVMRFFSHLRAHSLTEATALMWIKNKKPSPKENYMEGYPVVNSMVIRQLLGRERFIDTRPVDENDLEQAKKQVDKFDAFVPLEYLYHEQVLNLLRTRVPEYYSGLTPDGPVQNKRQRTKESTFGPLLIQKVEEENVFDYKLYEYILEKLEIEHQGPIETALSQLKYGKER